MSAQRLEARRELDAHFSDAERALHTRGGPIRFSPTTIRGLLAGLRAFARQEQRLEALAHQLFEELMALGREPTEFERNMHTALRGILDAED